MKTTIPTLMILTVSATQLFSQNVPPYRDPSQPVESRVTDLLSRMTLDEKIDMIGGFEEFYILPNERLGIPKIRMADGPLGVRNDGPATAFPAPIGIAASWDADLMHSFGAAVGKDARAKGVHIMLAPGLNIYRAPMCGRNFEYLGEDPCLAAKMAAAYVKGLQSQGVGATAKHFAANNQEYARTTVSSDVDERTLQEIYLPAFKAAVTEGGAVAVMTSYNLINGVHASQNEHLIMDILKGQWKFDGIVMSDWGSTWDGVAAANAGLDLEMPSGDYMNRATLMPAIKDGRVKQSTIDDKVSRILRVIFRMGFFDRVQRDTTLPRYSPDSRLVALQAAREGIVLLKNQGDALPFDRTTIGSVAVIGPNAYPAVTGGGGSSLVDPFRSISVLEGMIQTAGNGVRVLYNNGFTEDDQVLFRNSVFMTGSERGLRGEFFPNMVLEGTPAFTRTDETIDFVWDKAPAEGFPKEGFSVRWTGKIHVDSGGVYRFVARGDDGFRLYIGGQLIINEWRDQSTLTASTSMPLKGGRDYDVRFEYYQNGGGAIAGLGWGPALRQVDPEAVRIARSASAAVVCVGFDDQTEGEGSDRKFALPREQEDLIRAIGAANRRTVVVLIAGGNVAMAAWLDRVAGLVHAWYPGQEGGTAIAEVLFGDVNPSGKLPASFEKRWEDNACYTSYYDNHTLHVSYSEGVFLGYRHFDRDGIEPQFPFGFGLSYTTFTYAHASLNRPVLNKGGRIDVAFDITNTGKREGAEVAQLYIRQLAPGEPRPVKELKGFTRVHLKPGETKRISLPIDESMLSYFNSKKAAWIAEPGEFEVLIGSSSRLIQLTKGFTYSGK